MTEKRFDPILNKVTDIIDFIMASPDLPEDEGIRFKVNLCSEEIAKNLCDYAYENGQGYVVATTFIKDGMLKIKFRDEGVPFNPIDKPDPDITLSAEDRSIGGLGIFLCKQMMDSISYSFDGNCNIFEMGIKINKQ